MACARFTEHFLEHCWSFLFSICRIMRRRRLVTWTVSCKTDLCLRLQLTMDSLWPERSSWPVPGLFLYLPSPITPPGGIVDRQVLIFFCATCFRFRTCFIVFVLFFSFVINSSPPGSVFVALFAPERSTSWRESYVRQLHQAMPGLMVC